METKNIEKTYEIELDPLTADMLKNTFCYQKNYYGNRIYFLNQNKLYELYFDKDNCWVKLNKNTVKLTFITKEPNAERYYHFF